MAETAESLQITPATSGRIQEIFKKQHGHQYTVARTTARQRIEKLRRLHTAMIRHRSAIRQALAADFRKPAEETDISETAYVNTEIRHTIRHLARWMQPRRVGVGLSLLGSSARVIYEPKGVCLIIGTWNFPFNLNLVPLIAAVASGNCVILKPSEHAPHSAALIEKILRECFREEEVAVVQGEVEVARQLLQLPFNHIFFTGSTSIGKEVMQAAARHLASVTLELGGKTPVIVDETADLDRAASRIAWIKCLNYGQTCIAPDHVLVHESVHDALVGKLKEWLQKYYGDTPEARRQSPDLARVVHDRQFRFLLDLKANAVDLGAKVAFGGEFDPAERFIDPTILTDVPPEAKIWEHEIFGCLLPIKRYQTLDEAIEYINTGSKPLAFYIFSNRERHIKKVIRETRGGGVCVNECALQFFNPDLPFGGHNASGIGKYHGDSGFMEFSNARSIARQHSSYPTTNLFLPPYGSRLMKTLLNWLVRWL
ncbi:MAG: aldehyde dehydrogenase family protein [Bacteroidetes bacterium]|nr:MAG: aldehyde dehydrogenase family protein [Bacteroidota bacterium]